MVRLLHQQTTSAFFAHCSFNPTMVRLLPLCSPESPLCAARFNPTMVRLLQLLMTLKSPTEPWFQSHNGAIAAGSNLTGTVVVSAVSIPQWCDCCEPTLLALWNGAKFQSHNGAIAARSFAVRL